MEKNVNQLLAMLFVVLVMILTFSSCTDQDDIEISYGTTLKINASHIFDDFQEMNDGDFSLESHPEFKLRITTLVYDRNNNLVDESEQKFNSIYSTLEYDTKHLLPGTYQIISIADFVNDGNDNGLFYWEIRNKGKLDLLNISQQVVYNSNAFSVLGLSSTTYEVGDHSKTIEISIKASTALIGIHIWGEDVTGTGIQGYCPIFPYLQSIGIIAKALNTEVNFGNGEFKYKYPEQSTSHNLAQISPANIVLNGEAPNRYMYKAVLPTQNVDMFWFIRIVSGLEDQLGFDQTYVESSGQEELFNMECGKQYDLDLEVGADGLFFQNHNPEESVEDRRLRNFDACNQRDFDNVMDRSFEELLGTSRDMIELMFKDYGLIISNDTQLSYRYNAMIDGLVFGFNSNNRVRYVGLVLNEQNYNTDFEARLIKMYSDKYFVYSPMTTSRYKTFIDAENKSDATLNIMIDTKDKSIMITKLK